MKTAMLSVLALLGCFTHAAIASGPVVNTTYGPVRGETVGSVDIFHSIPFAAPPVKDLRFKAPQPPQPWTEVKDVTASPNICPQLKIDGDIFLGNEDCLYLHLYRPKDISPDEKLPVMVWIFGGGWVLGDGDEFGWYDGTNLATKHNAIVVAMNYRVGPFGFMALSELAQEDSRGALGSMGLQDQRAAMKWTQDNIAAFGGDPSQVSIFGESAGGFSVCWHLVSPASKGLFRAAIIESGSCDSPQFFRQKNDAIAFGKLYSEAIGCSGTGSALLECLRSQNTEHIMKSLLDFFDPNWPFTNSSTAGQQALAAARDAIVETAALRQIAKAAGDDSGRANSGLRGARQADAGARLSSAIESVRSAVGTSAFASRSLSSALSFFPAFAPIMAWGAPIDGVDLTDLPLGMMEKGQMNSVPAIFGSNKDEANLFVPALPIVIKGAPLLPTAASFNLTIKHVLGVYDPAKVQAVMPIINNVYSSSAYHDDQWDRVSTAFTDYFFLCGMQRSARAWSKAGNKAYMYRFTRNPGWIDTDLLGDYHTIELDFVWDNAWPPIVHIFDEDDQQLAEQMGEFWTSMAREGQPDGDLTWPTYNGTASSIMQLDSPISLQPSPQQVQCQMWDTVIAELGAPQ